MMTLEEITDSAKALPPIEREAEQTTEIGRRIAEIDSGEVEGIPAEQVFAELRKRLDAARK